MMIPDMGPEGGLPDGIGCRRSDKVQDAGQWMLRQGRPRCETAPVAPASPAPLVHSPSWRRCNSPRADDDEAAQHGWLVKNTFLHMDGFDGDSPHGRARANSQPPMKSPSVAGRGAPSNDDSDCDLLGLPGQLLYDDHDCVNVGAGPRAGNGATATAFGDGVSVWIEQVSEDPLSREATGVENAPQERHGPRWWTHVEDRCVLSNFPLQLLPYPPFKFMVGRRNAPDSWLLVDGQFLLLKVLSEWNFEVQWAARSTDAPGAPPQAMSRKMTPANIEALDEYMRRCKLGRWRLASAIEARSKAELGDAAALVEWHKQQDLAASKLSKLMEIQQVRFNKWKKARKGNCEGASTPSGTSSRVPLQPRMPPQETPRTKQGKAARGAGLGARGPALETPVKLERSTVAMTPALTGGFAEKPAKPKLSFSGTEMMPAAYRQSLGLGFLGSPARVPLSESQPNMLPHPQQTMLQHQQQLQHFVHQQQLFLQQQLLGQQQHQQRLDLHNAVQTRQLKANHSCPETPTRAPRRPHDDGTGCFPEAWVPYHPSLAETPEHQRRQRPGPWCSPLQLPVPPDPSSPLIVSGLGSLGQLQRLTAHAAPCLPLPEPFAAPSAEIGRPV